MNMKILCSGSIAAGILAAVMLTACAAEPEMQIDNEAIKGNTITYDISSSEPLSGALICAVYDENGILSGVSTEKKEIAQQEWTININADFEKGMSKIFFWNSIDGMKPWVKPVSSACKEKVNRKMKKS